MIRWGPLFAKLKIYGEPEIHLALESVMKLLFVMFILCYSVHPNQIKKKTTT